MLSRRDHLRQAAALLSLKYGRNAVEDPRPAAVRERPRIVTPSLGLNYVWWGGLSWGRTHMFVGEEHSGKSLTCAVVLAAAQTCCRNCLRPFRRVSYGPPGACTDPAAMALDPECAWQSDGKAPFRPVRNEETGEVGRVVSWRWRTKQKRNVWVCVAKSADGELSAGQPAVFQDVPIDEQEKTPWRTCAEHGVVLDVPYCSCLFDGAEPPWWVVLEDVKDGKKVELTSKLEDVKARDERLAMWRQTGNSYDAVYALYVDLEDKCEPPWMARQGVDLSRVQLAGFGCGEDVADAVDAYILQGIYDVIVIDSIEYMEPEAQAEGSTHEGEDQGRGAKLVNRALRKWTLSLGKVRRMTGRRPTMLLVNQFRRDRQGFPVLPKGRGQLFAPSSRTRFWTSDWDQDGEQVGQKDEKRVETLSVRVNMRTEKCCMGPNKLQASFDLRIKPRSYKGRVLVPEGRIDDYGFVYRAARTYGLVTAAPGAWQIFGERTFRTEEELKIALAEDPEMFRRLQAECLGKMMEAHRDPEERW